ncbi:MAG: type II toxin-antitoxin system VapC family toxin [Limnospira sp. PMC 1291.21]|uniref:PIN domain-containing protein n=2 Tax=Limnospira TaxID=2596745 RepID=A0A9P1KC78_9CYAN|nr:MULTISPECIES: type II toxin-antitoxin system VapC family toxin [Limnospira]MDY7052047.1 type II toxin-antitoxin system VapC family toxin [Limnospira fusiformis LS22]MDT9176226.1 type II toxin-antitoxin system VapC family toxin [Limnospira sp. PMC 1238.20]MDT9191530.1 type II toxin-antitoxin system VapC family toxin [Limnospira sp. PMC 1245.20]MDT9196582.1 type II toxin-antitoxin system VapC family toxin [Limnospira sp. PMC 1042.18]MDT9201775.1 type II toxin-antitoxin system VapC family toxi
MYLLDTNHCSYLIKKEATVWEKALAIGTENLATCVIVQGELILMAEKSAQKTQNLANVNDFLQYLRIYLTDETTAVIYGQIKAALFDQFAPKEKSQRRKTKIRDIGFDDNDLWIASIAWQHNLILVSADSDFQRIQTVRDLTVESWYRPTN